MWAWLPAFLTVCGLTAAMPGSGAAGGAAIQGVWIAAAIHLSGFLSSLTMGKASDRLGRRTVLMAMGLLGAACSLTIGWMQMLPPSVMPWMILPVAALYGFSALGDSPVLSTAMTESVEPGRLGAALAVRSILGFGAGGLAPLAVGLILNAEALNDGPLNDGTLNGGSGWGWGFTLLGVGGILAAICAALLPADRPAPSPALPRSRR
jgi:MFS family permease